MKKKNIKLSIIIPVYNVEIYVEDCVESVINQKLEEYEIILVDDGSKDNSGVICDQIAEKYDCVHVIHKKNGGLSSARNTGIDAALGDYLMFIDSDDFISSSKIADLYQYMNQDYDIIQYKPIYYYEDQGKYLYLKDMVLYNNCSYIEQLKKKIQDGSLSIPAWDKIVKRELIIKNNIYFTPDIFSEDVDWSLKLYSKASSMFSVNLDLYVYRQNRKGSITGNIKEKNIESSYFIIDKWVNMDYESEKFKVLFYNSLAYQYCILLCNINKNNCSSELKKKIYDYKWLLKYDNNYKVKLCNRIFNVVGINLGRKILNFYILQKNKGRIKL